MCMAMWPTDPGILGVRYPHICIRETGHEGKHRCLCREEA